MSLFYYVRVRNLSLVFVVSFFNSGFSYSALRSSSHQRYQVAQPSFRPRADDKAETAGIWRGLQTAFRDWPLCRSRNPEGVWKWPEGEAIATGLEGEATATRQEEAGPRRRIAPRVLEGGRQRRGQSASFQRRWWARKWRVGNPQKWD